MSDANKALAEVRGWLCDNLSSGDAGKVCGMLSSVSRRINELEAENAELKKAMDFQALELSCMTDNRDVLYVENAKLRELVRDMMEFFEDGDWCVKCERDLDCQAQEQYEDECLMRFVFRDRMRELGVEI